MAEARYFNVGELGTKKAQARRVPRIWSISNTYSMLRLYTFIAQLSIVIGHRLYMKTARLRVWLSCRARLVGYLPRPWLSGVGNSSAVVVSGFGSQAFKIVFMEISLLLVKRIRA